MAQDQERTSVIYPIRPNPGAAEQPALLEMPAASTAADPLVGSIVGSFRLVRKLGDGGMGTVYLAEHTLIGSKVAMKFLHEHFASNGTLIQRFLAEARAVNLIGHENIINIFDMNVLPPLRHYLIMEYLEGHSLAAMTGKPVEPQVVLSILSQVCDALQATHASGVIHRDLKPENIFLVRHDRMPHFVKVLDFGIAKLMDSALSGQQTATGTILGTPEYMAPEQWYGHAVDGRTDLYALGIIAYELLVGHSPFKHAGVGNLLHAHLMENPPAPHELRPEVPQALSQAVMRAISKRPEDRFPDAVAMRTALAQALAPAPTPQAIPASQSTPVPMPTSAPTPTAAPIPMPVELSAWVSLQPGEAPVHLPCTDLTRAGAFLCTEGALPAMRSRLAMSLEVQGRKLPCSAEVVHHVTTAQASTWRMRPGFAVQFVQLSDEVREAVHGLLKGHTPAPPVPKAIQDDPQADSLLGPLFRRVKNDPYALLCLQLDATFDDVRKHARSSLAFLEPLASRTLSPRQEKDLREMRTRLEKAASVLGHAHQRLEHDGWRGNYAGVARCIASGVSASELDALRIRFLEEHPGAEAVEQIHMRTAMAWEAQGKTELALREYERALRANPLRLSLQQRYWSLKQRGARLSAAAGPGRDA